VTKDIVSWVEKHTGPAYKPVNSNEELAAEIASAKGKPVVIAVLADQAGPVAQQFFSAAQDDTTGAVYLIASPGSVTDGLPASDSLVLKVLFFYLVEPMLNILCLSLYPQVSGRADESIPVDPIPQAKSINDWVSVYSLPLVVPFSQVRLPSFSYAVQTINLQCLMLCSGNSELHLWISSEDATLSFHRPEEGEL
jgi:hypothetical protein